MKHIILPLNQILGKTFDYLAAYPENDKKNAGIIFHADNQQPSVLQQGNDNSCWQYEASLFGSTAAENLRTIIESHRAQIDPDGDERFVTDVVVDAANISHARELLDAIYYAAPWIQIHIIFLAEHYSDYGDAQSEFYRAIRNDTSGGTPASGLKWTWFTMLADQNSNGVTSDVIRDQRYVLLPYLFRDDHNGENAHTCYTYAIRYKKLHYDKISSIPRFQAMRYACRSIQATETFNESALLLMNHETWVDDPNSQIEILQRHLLEAADFRPITGMDLLIQKHDPETDCSVRTLLEAALQDNPDRDARTYDGAETEEELTKLPIVRKAVKAWDKYVVEHAQCHTGLEHLRNQLINDSEWARLISQDFQSNYIRNNPLDMCTLTLKKKDGYDLNAAAKAEDDLKMVNQQLKDAIFQACLRLMSLQLQQTFKRIDRIIAARYEAVNKILESLEETKDAEEMTAGWCQVIQEKLKDASVVLPIHINPDDDPEDIIKNYAESLLNYIHNQVDIRDGYEEIANPEYVNQMMCQLRDTTTPYPLINPQLTGGACIRKDDLWFVSDRLFPTLDPSHTEKIEKPLVLNLTRYYLYPAADTAPNPDEEEYTNSLFQGPIIQLKKKVTVKDQKPDFAHKQEQEESEKIDRFRNTSRKFDWICDEADAVIIRYYLFRTETPLKTLQIEKHKFGGNFEAPLINTLPSGARIEIEVVFQRYGHDIGILPERLYIETNRMKLAWKMETNKVKTSLFSSRSYCRLRVPVQENLTGKVGVRNAESGCICSRIDWHRDGYDYVTQYLPADGIWTLANLPQSPYIYEFDEA